MTPSGERSRPVAQRGTTLTVTHDIKETRRPPRGGRSPWQRASVLGIGGVRLSEFTQLQANSTWAREVREYRFSNRPRADGDPEYRPRATKASSHLGNEGKASGERQLPVFRSCRAKTGVDAPRSPSCCKTASLPRATSDRDHPKIACRADRDHAPTLMTRQGGRLPEIDRRTALEANSYSPPVRSGRRIRGEVLIPDRPLRRSRPGRSTTRRQRHRIQRDWAAPPSWMDRTVRGRSAGTSALEAGDRSRPNGVTLIAEAVEVESDVALVFVVPQFELFDSCPSWMESSQDHHRRRTDSASRGF